MKTFVVLTVAAALGILFALQHHSTPTISKPPSATAPRSVSEHDWAKHALDTTAKVRGEVARQRTEPTP